jgi:hypothetical protein
VLRDGERGGVAVAVVGDTCEGETVSTYGETEVEKNEPQRVRTESV